MSPFNGKIAIVTGGASGIGRSLCEELAQRGATVIVADLNGEGAAELAGKLGAHAHAVQVDVSDFDAVKHVVQETAAGHGRLDFMFNNAGIAVVGELRDTAPEHWRKVVDVNLMGVIYGTMAAYSVMIPQGAGHILNVSSVTGLMPTPILTPYGTTKWAIIGFSLSVRPEAASLGIRVSVACPSIVRTNIADGGTYLNVQKEDYLARLPWRWMMEPSQVAKAILRGVAANRAMIVCPWHGRLLWWLYRISPGLVTRLSGWTVKEWRKLRVPPS